jgi:hypothetical protein
MFGADNTEEVQHRNTELVTTLLICMFVGCGGIQLLRIFSGVYLCITWTTHKQITWTNSLTNKSKSEGLLCKFVSDLVQVIHQ